MTPLFSTYWERTRKGKNKVYYWMSGSFSSLNYASLDCRSASHRKVDSWFFFIPTTFFSLLLSWPVRAFLLFQLKHAQKNHEKQSNNNLNFSIFFSKRHCYFNVQRCHQQNNSIIHDFLIVKRLRSGSQFVDFKKIRGEIVFCTNLVSIFFAFLCA